MTAGLPLIKNILTLLVKSLLIPLRSTAVASATGEAIQKNIHGSGITALIISNEEMEESGLLIKGISETIKNEANKQEGGFLPVLLRTLAAVILGNALAGKGVVRAGEGVIRSGQNF